MPFTIPNESAATHANMARVSSSDIDVLAAGFVRSGVLSGCAVTAQGTPDMTVAVGSGTIEVAGASATVTAGNVTITAANASNPRMDLVVANSSGVKSVVAGTAAVSPVQPAVPANSIVLAMVYVPANQTAIQSNLITDKRVLLAASGASAGYGLGVFNIRDAAYGAVGDGTTDDGPAIRSAYSALVTAGGGTLYFPPGTYYCNTVATAGAITITRDNASTRRQTHILLAGGAVVKLSTNTPRFIDFGRIAANDIFRALTVEGGTIDANSIGGRHHVVIGNFKAGGSDADFNLDGITVQNMRVINVTSQAAYATQPTNHRLVIYLAVSQSATAISPRNYITNITVRNVRIEGGNQGICVLGSGSSPYPGYTLWIDNVLIENCYHDTLLPSPSYFYGVNYHIGSVAQCGRVTVRNCYGANAGDDGVEVNATDFALIENCHIHNAFAVAFYAVNFVNRANCTQKWINCTASSDSTLAAAFEVGAGRNSARGGLAIVHIESTGSGVFEHVEVTGFRYLLDGHNASISAGNGMYAIAANAFKRLDLRDIHTQITSLAADNTGGNDVYASLIRITGVANDNALYANRGDQIVTVNAEDIHWRSALNRTGAGAIQIRGMYLDGPDATIRLDRMVYELTSTGTALAGNSMHPLQLAAGGSGHGLRGSVRRLLVRSQGSDTDKHGIHVGSTSNVTVNGQLTIQDCDFSPLGAQSGTDIAVGAGHGSKVRASLNALRDGTLT